MTVSSRFRGKLCHQKFQVPKMEVFIYLQVVWIRLKGNPTSKTAGYKVQETLHDWYLNLLVIMGSLRFRLKNAFLLRQSGDVKASVDLALKFQLSIWCFDRCKAVSWGSSRRASCAWLHKMGSTKTVSGQVAPSVEDLSPFLASAAVGSWKSVVLPPCA